MKSLGLTSNLLNTNIATNLEEIGVFRFSKAYTETLDL